ncbi:carbohydrate ABC transporter permease [Eisenbergiella tayi]|uniref:L-arabinose transport system permease protein AraQ n=1 Tax=Eisenbergiella tayi TaxID=1432052 RepID=A0A1E3AFM5_9FIRM|nr:carbohydrate ABC transporter permease [Eisenbergiella tayi]ODM06996.1 L-arabinose transport system permease protein AraQ [Eisenbergiella tayi]ODR35605.1 sugar ABC transporter permease [Eisenbergiella tayi]
MKKKNSNGWGFRLINGIILAVISLMTLYPFLYVIFASFSDPVKLMGNSSLLLKPLGFSLNAYKKVFVNPSIYSGYLNTIFYVAAGTLVNILATCMAAYVLSRKQFMLRRFLTIMFIFTMYFNGGLIPSYLLIKDLGLINSRLSLILPGAVSTFNLMIMITGFEGIPQSLEESARIDGAGDWTILFRIIMPLAKPTIMVILLYYAVGHWNSWFNAMIYLRDADKMPIQIFLRDILTRSQLGAMTGQTDVEDVGQTIKYATIIVSTVPILCIYPFIQKHFVKGVMIGAVKE